MTQNCRLAEFLSDPPYLSIASPVATNQTKKGVNVMPGILASGNGASVSTLLSETASGMTAEIGAALPIAGGIFATIAGIFIGVKIFKRITGART